MKKFVQHLIDAFNPASLRSIERQRELAAEETRFRAQQRQKEADKKLRLFKETLDPVMSVLVSLPAKDGKMFRLKPEIFTDSIFFGNGKDDSSFGFGTLRKTIFGNIRHELVPGLEEMSQKEMAQLFAAWLHDVAPDRFEEVQKAMKQTANTKYATNQRKQHQGNVNQDRRTTP